MNSEIIKKKKNRIFKLKKKEGQFLVRAVFISISLFFLIIGLVKFLNLNKSTNEVGDTIGGILGTIFSFFGSILVFMALKAQIKANQIINRQFIKQEIKENEDYLYNKYAQQINLISNEINNFYFSDIYIKYLKKFPTSEKTNQRLKNYYLPISVYEENEDEFERKRKEYEESKRTEKRNYEGIQAITELFGLISLGMLNRKTENFDYTIDNPKLNEIYNLLHFFNETYIEILKQEFNLNNRDYANNTKEDLIKLIQFYYNSKLKTIVNKYSTNKYLPEEIIKVLTELKKNFNEDI